MAEQAGQRVRLGVDEVGQVRLRALPRLVVVPELHGEGFQNPLRILEPEPRGSESLGHVQRSWPRAHDCAEKPRPSAGGSAGASSGRGGASALAGDSFWTATAVHKRAR
ncbi:hypothetical protein MRX96_025040 [Rhipicephalus microplus]